MGKDVIVKISERETTNLMRYLCTVLNNKRKHNKAIEKNKKKKVNHSKRGMRHGKKKGCSVMSRKETDYRN